MEGYLEGAARRCRQRKLVLVRFSKNLVVLKILNPFYHSLLGSASKHHSIFRVNYFRSPSCGVNFLWSKLESFSSSWRIILCSDNIWLQYTSNLHNRQHFGFIIWEAKFGNAELVAYTKTKQFINLAENTEETRWSVVVISDDDFGSFVKHVRRIVVDSK